MAPHLHVVIKSVNNKSKNYTPNKIKFHIDRVEKSIQAYLGQMDTQDSDEKNIRTTVPSSKLAWLKQRLSELKKLEKIFAEQYEKKYHQNTVQAEKPLTVNIMRPTPWGLSFLNWPASSNSEAIRHTVMTRLPTIRSTKV
jgi:hypothetical protein